MMKRFSALLLALLLLPALALATPDAELSAQIWQGLGDILALPWQDASVALTAIDADGYQRDATLDTSVFALRPGWQDGLRLFFWWDDAQGPQVQGAALTLPDALAADDVEPFLTAALGEGTPLGESTYAYWNLGDGAMLSYQREQHSLGVVRLDADASIIAQLLGAPVTLPGAEPAGDSGDLAALYQGLRDMARLDWSGAYANNQLMLQGLGYTLEAEQATGAAYRRDVDSTRLRAIIGEDSDNPGKLGFGALSLPDAAPTPQQLLASLTDVLGPYQLLPTEGSEYWWNLGGGLGLHLGSEDSSLYLISVEAGQLDTLFGEPISLPDAP